jgi:large subunit ribosomal protein L6
MSRIGRLPIQIPDKVKLAVDGFNVRVEGPKGKMESKIARGMTVKSDGKTVTVQRPDDTREARQLHGLTRTIVANMVKGVTQGWERSLEISGVGFKAEVQGNKINFALGYSHPVVFPLPQGITAEFDQKTNKITLRGADKHLVGMTAAQIRGLRVPDPYKAKGIKYSEETIRRKVGKTGAA